MKAYLTKLIDAAPEEDKGAVQLQIVLGAGMFSGAVRHAVGEPGLFELLTPNIDRQTGQPSGMVRMIFDPDALVAVLQAYDDDKPILHVPSRQIIPGAGTH